MLNNPHKSLMAAGITLALLTCHPAMAADPEASSISNTRQEVQIWTTYALSPYLRAHDITVSVEAGKAILTGEVNDDASKELAEQIALSVDDIKSVDNQLVVREEPKKKTESADRSYGDIISDATITALVKSKLLWSKHAEGLATEVETQNGKVTLKGTADSGAAKEIAELLAKSTDGVTGVDNRLVIKPDNEDAKSKDKNTKKDSGQPLSDAWITTKVKSTFMYSSNIDGSDISVDTKNGVVTLSGKLGADKDAERALAIQLAENIKGVKSVNAKALKLK